MGTLVFQATLGGSVNLIGPNTASTINFTLPSADGSSGQTWTTNGSGVLSFGTLGVAGGGTGVTTSTGTGSVVLSTSPTLVTPILGTPTSATLTNATGLPISTGVSGLGTGIATALAVNTGSAGAPVLFNGALGTPTSGTLTNATGLPLTTGVTGTLPIANGGTNSTATATAGGIGYGTGTAHAYTAAGTSGQVLTSAGASAPTWTTPTSSQWTTTGSDIYYTTGQVWINKTSNVSGARLQTQGATDSAFTAFSVNASTNDGYMGIGYSSSGSVWQIWPTYNATAGYKPLAFVVGGSEVARFPTASGFQCVNSISVGNATPTTSGAGITFPATQSASTNANTLDDYEEGTFTPTDVSGASLSFTYTIGIYTKIGNLVTIAFRADYPTTASAITAYMSIPFAPISGSTYASGALWTNNATARTTTPVDVGYARTCFLAANTITTSLNSQLSGSAMAGSLTFQTS